MAIKTRTLPSEKGVPNREHPLLDIGVELWGDTLHPLIVCSSCGSSCEDTPGCSTCAQYYGLHERALEAGCAAVVVVTEALWKCRHTFPAVALGDEGVAPENWRLAYGSEIYEGTKDPSGVVG